IVRAVAVQVRVALRRAPRRGLSRPTLAGRGPCRRAPLRRTSPRRDRDTCVNEIATRGATRGSRRARRDIALKLQGWLASGDPFPKVCRQRPARRNRAGGNALKAHKKG